MAHFAKLDANNIVTQVIVVDNNDIKDNEGNEVESIGIAFCRKLFGGDTNWKQTSYNNKFRGNYAGIGATYMTNVATLGVASTDIFINQQPHPSWSIGVGTAHWYSPLGLQPTPTDSEMAAGKTYIWDEDAYNADTNNPKTVGWALTTP
tara:strand:+ start:360 stop:806 length:447 start_codon:yes stop_codon:yes gene_type:complete